MRQRIDYMPGTAAIEAIEHAEALKPRMRRQDLIDLLVIRGLWTIKHEPPALPGVDRDRWHLPDSLRNSEPKRSTAPGRDSTDTDR